MNNPWRRYAPFIGLSVLAHLAILGGLAWWLSHTYTSPAPPRPAPVAVTIVPRPVPPAPKPKPVRIAALPTPPTPRAVPSPTPTPTVAHAKPRPTPAVQHVTRIVRHLLPHPTRGGHAAGAAPARKAPTVRHAPGKPRHPVLTASVKSDRTAPALGTTDGHEPAAASPNPSPDNGVGDQSRGVGDGAGKGTGQGKDSGAGDVGTEDGIPDGPFGVPTGGAGSGPRHIVYVLDVSGSMATRIDRVREELRAAVAGLKPGESFDVLAFSDNVHRFEDHLIDATPDNIARAKSFVDSLQPLQGTNLQDAMRDALRMRGVNVIFLISDGVPSVKETNPGKLRREIRGRNRDGARIYTIGLAGYNPIQGGVSDFEAADLLRSIAEDSGGTYKTVALGDASP